MKFYNGGVARDWDETPFQFPTGWNSTKTPFSSKQAVKSFNSQRDEILLLFPFILFDFFNVSIPNGMKFYLSFLRISTHILKFQFPTGWNSTFRGFYCFFGCCFVSIPNGMKFYDLGNLNILKDFEFQFPTGWNSTEVRREFHPSKWRFNSQRDGILLI